MDFIVNMVRDSTEPGGRDRFSCRSTEWDLLLELAEAFGWKPKGVAYVPAPGVNRTASTTRHDYRPGSDRDYKQVEAADAIGWATALSEARRSPHLAAMIAARTGNGTPDGDATDGPAPGVDTAFAAILDEFIEYAFGGGFSFAGRS